MYVCIVLCISIPFWSPRIHKKRLRTHIGSHASKLAIAVRYDVRRPLRESTPASQFAADALGLRLRFRVHGSEWQLLCMMMPSLSN